MIRMIILIFPPPKIFLLNPSKWAPKTISQGTKELISDLREITEKTLLKYKLNNKNYYQLKNRKHNLSKEQRHCIQTLKGNEDIVIKSSDKGGLVCILHKTSYMNEAYRQLNNVKYYKRIDISRRVETIPKINDVLRRLEHKSIITTRQLQYTSEQVVAPLACEHQFQSRQIIS